MHGSPVVVFIFFFTGGQQCITVLERRVGNIPADNFSISILVVEESGFYMVGSRTTGASSSVDR